MSQAPTQPSQQQASQPEPFKFQSAPDQQRPTPKHYIMRSTILRGSKSMRLSDLEGFMPTVEMKQQELQSQQPNDSERAVDFLALNRFLQLSDERRELVRREIPFSIGVVRLKRSKKRKPSICWVIERRTPLSRES